MIGKKEGLLTKKEERFYAKLILKSLKIKGVLGGLLRIVAPLLISVPDNKYGDKVPQPFQGYLEDFTTLVYQSLIDGKVTNEEKDTLILYCGNVISAEVGLLDDASEFVSFWKWVAGIVRSKLLKNK